MKYVYKTLILRENISYLSSSNQVSLKDPCLRTVYSLKISPIVDGHAMQAPISQSQVSYVPSICNPVLEQEQLPNIMIKKFYNQLEFRKKECTQLLSMSSIKVSFYFQRFLPQRVMSSPAM